MSKEAIAEDFLMDSSSIKSNYSSKKHKYELTQKEAFSIFHRKIYQEIIKSDAFQRLKNIHFLGSIDYTIDSKGPKPNKRHTRYQHSLGVAQLALQYSLEKKLSESEEIMCVVSALLHDIGHAPLSHSLESVFKEKFGISHHISGERIMKGEEPIGESLNKILNKWKINLFKIMLIVSGLGESPYKEIFKYSINIDTIEAILRSSTYIDEKYIFYTPSMILSALLGKEKDSVSILDTFWHLKGLVYSELINSELGVVADYLCQKYMIDNAKRFEESYYYGTEKQLKEDHKRLFQLLERMTDVTESELLPDKDQIQCIKRKFFIERNADLVSTSADGNIILVTPRLINNRYKQEKTKHIYKIDKMGKYNKYGTKSNQESLFLL